MPVPPTSGCSSPGTHSSTAAPAVDRALRHAVKSSSIYKIEHRIRTANGDWKWIESHGKVVARDAAGRALRMTGTNADIDERKRRDPRPEPLQRLLLRSRAEPPETESDRKREACLCHEQFTTREGDVRVDCGEGDEGEREGT